MNGTRSAASLRASTSTAPVIVIGAGPAGLTAAYELCRTGIPTKVFDLDERVGGLAQTASYKDFRFDIGGHRFFTKVRLVQALWRQMLGADFLKRPRLSRIFYGGRFFHYPLKAGNTLRNLGVWQSLVVLASYVRAKLFPIQPEVSFEDWISNRFGRALFTMFFKSYTEKVWGIPCNQISAQWAAQRIKGLSLRTTLINMLFRDRRGGIKTLIGEFEYPRLGPGMMWERFQQRIVSAGGQVTLQTRVVRLVHDGQRITRVDVDRRGERSSHDVSHVITTMPIRELVAALDPPMPEAAVEAANRLSYRDFITVALILRQRDVFPDNWIYIHEPSVKVGRIQNFKNWSPEMVPDAEMTCLGLEYFCTEGDGLWEMSDADLVALGARELVQIGLAGSDVIIDGTVVRAHKAYPVYDAGYSEALTIVRRYLDRFSNLQLVGRNGMHKYNNQDHSMLTAILAVRNLLGERHDLWNINAEDEYHEEISDIEPAPGVDEVTAGERQALAATQPSVPMRVERAE